jgi:hypothetical protein
MQENYLELFNNSLHLTNIAHFLIDLQYIPELSNLTYQILNEPIKANISKTVTDDRYKFFYMNQEIKLYSKLNQITEGYLYHGLIKVLDSKGRITDQFINHCIML